jgi:CBS domain-containing protein
MVVRDILQHKGVHVHSIGSSATMTEAAQRMMEFRCGSLVVLDGQQLVGIITERDVLRTCATGKNLDHVAVAESMTRDVVTGTADDDVQQVMGVLTRQRIRHLPILENGQLIGLVSIGDVVKCQYDALEFENHVLKSYIYF